MLVGQSKVHVAPAAPATTVVLDVAVLLDGSALGSFGGGVLLASCGSAVSLDMFPVLEIIVPAAVPVFTLQTKVSLALAPAANEVRVQVVVPPLLFAAGNVQFQFASSIWPDKKVVLAGVTSVTTTFDAASGPLLASHSTYSIFDPAVIVPSELLAL